MAGQPSFVMLSRAKHPIHVTTNRTNLIRCFTALSMTNACFSHSRAYLATANPTMMLQTRYFFGFYYFYATA